MTKRDCYLAAKILVDFIRDFNLLTEMQLLAIRHLMRQTVEEIMESVSEMSERADESNRRASEILRLNELDGSFSSSPIPEMDDSNFTGTNEHLKIEYLETRLRRSGGLFSKHMKAMDLLSREMQELIMHVIGSLSIDDVLGQRLTHAITSIRILKDALSEVISNYEMYQNPSEVKILRNKILNAVYGTYSSEDEREVFHRIFGKPKHVRIPNAI